MEQNEVKKQYVVRINYDTGTVEVVKTSPTAAKMFVDQLATGGLWVTATHWVPPSRIVSAEIL